YHLGQPPLNRLLRLALRLQREGDVLAHGQVRIEREKLEDEGNVALAGVQAGHVAPAEVDRAAGDGFQPGDHAQGGRLAAARRTEQYDELHIVDGQVEGLDGLMVAESLIYLPKLEFGYKSLPLIMIRERLSTD